MIKYSIALCLLVFTYSVKAQPELGFCDQNIEELASKQIPRALKNWKTGNYSEAERYLKNALEQDPEYADALFLLGDLYVRKTKLEHAEALWAKLIEVCPNYKPEVAYFLGAIYLENKKWDKAKQAFYTFLENPERDTGYDTEVEAALQEAIEKEKLFSNPVVFEPKSVKGISTLEDEYLASISPNQELMFFTRRSKKVNRRDGPAARVRLVEEFSLSKKIAPNTFEKGEPLPAPFNTSYNEGGPSITADNTELYFTVCEDLNGYKNCDIYFSEKDGYGGWTTPVSVGDHINRRDSWESQASVSANGDALFFTSNRAEGLGGLDIYKCERKEDGSWGKPKNIGAPVNTPKNEKTPFIHSDSKTLYFTSDGLNGLGGYDIYFSKEEDSVWDSPTNIGYPINSKNDDLGLFVSLDGKTAYFCSNEIKQSGGWDIFQFELPEMARPEQVALIQGELTDENNEAVTDASLEIKNLRTKEVTKIKVDKETGSYARVVTVNPQEDLILTVKKEGTAFSSKLISARERKKDPVVKAPLEVAKLEIGKEYKLNDINFASNSYALSEESKNVIDEFIIYLKENPSLKADIQGHTDNVGNDTDNLNLSKNRAQTVYNYVISHGIEVHRIQHHGYGETKPIADNTDEEGRAQNRRTVFVITAQ